ncbi:MAG: hypothetical protein ACK4MM_00870, partial [Fervidobacterium sp.]
MKKFRKPTEILSFFVVLLVAVGTATIIFTIYNTIHLKTNAQRFTLYTNLLAKSISSAYFQWDELYQAVLNDDIEFAEGQIKAMKEEYEELVDATIVSLPPPLSVPEPYFIYSNNNLIFVSFKIYDSEKIEFVKNKQAVVEISPTKILENLRIKNINISPNGKLFVYNLRYTKKINWLDLVVFSTSLFVSFSLTAIYLLFVEVKLRKTEAVHKNALRAIA